MVKVNAIKDGLGNIVISEDSFEYLLSCLDNQKFNPTQDMQNYIDFYNNECRKILHQKYIFEAINDNYFLTKRYRYQDKITPWSGNDVGLVYELFKDTIMENEASTEKIKTITTESYKFGDEPLGITEDGWIMLKPELRPWLIERALRSDGDYLTISENGRTNRPWKEEEILNIQKLFNNEKKEIHYDIIELWNLQLEKMDISVIEKHLRKIKLKKL
jgi:hypothetical protein